MADFEWWKVVPSDAVKRLWAFLVELKRLMPNQRMGIYTANSFWKEYGEKTIGWAEFYLWLAQYNCNQPEIPYPWNNYTFWQYTSHGDGLKYGCESKDVDLNLFNGNLDELYQLAGMQREVKPIPKIFKVFMPFITR